MLQRPLHEALIPQTEPAAPTSLATRRLQLLTAAECVAILVVVLLHYTERSSTISLSGNTAVCVCDDFSCRVARRTTWCPDVGGPKPNCCVARTWDINEEVSGCSDDGLSCLHPVLSKAVTGLTVGCLVVAWSFVLWWSVCRSAARSRVTEPPAQQELSMQAGSMQQVRLDRYDQPPPQ